MPKRQVLVFLLGRGGDELDPLEGRWELVSVGGTFSTNEGIVKERMTLERRYEREDDPLGNSPDPSDLWGHVRAGEEQEVERLPVSYKEV